MHGLCLLTERVHYFESLACAQMSIGFGRQGHSHNHDELVPAPTGGLPYEIAVDKFPNAYSTMMKKSEGPRQFLVGQQTREMTIDEIHSEQKEYAKS